jgi:hypothetical protein
VAAVPRPTPRHLLTAVDLLATAVFALEGALAGIVAGLDVFGVLVIGAVTATGGGIVRDVLIGDIPPASLRQHRYLLAALGAGLAAIVFQGSPGRSRRGSSPASTRPDWAVRRRRHRQGVAVRTAAGDGGDHGHDHGRRWRHAARHLPR